MIGWLIYDEAGAKRNEWFINSLIDCAKESGAELLLKVLPHDDIYTEASLPDFVIVRSINPNINLFFEERGIPSFNNFKTSKIANNKWLTYKLGKELNIPVIETSLLTSKINSQEEIHFPCVLKSLDGHGGSEVFLINNRQELLEKAASIDIKNFILQRLCSSPGTDMRVYVLDGEILCGVIRNSKSDFRSNFSLGGTAKVGTVTDDQKAFIKKIYDELSFDLVGIDFIIHNDKWILNEIEDIVGTRMLYKYTDIDIAMLYIRHILNKANNKSK